VPKAEGNPARSAVAVLSVLIVLAAGALALWTARGSRDAVEPLAAGDLILTEVRDEPAGQVFIEIANRAGAGSNVDASQWSLVIDGQAQSLAPLGNIQNGRYRTIGDSPGDDLALALPLNPQGAVIQLMETTLVQDTVRTGQRGTAPDPLPGWTVSRHFDGTEYTSAWSLDSTPTWRAENDGPAAQRTPELVLNEVLYDAATPSGRFIELYYRGSGSLPLNGHRLTGNTAHNLLTFVTLSASNRHFLLWNDAGGAALLFDQLLLGGDNLYLFSPTGELLDEVGWSTTHPADTSVCRVPDGAGKPEGYDDPSSAAAGWRFGCAASPEWISLETAQSAYLVPGGSVTYSMVATNRQASPTLVDLTFAPPPAGWTVALLDAFMAPLADTDGSGAPDVAVGALGSPTETVRFYVAVMAPPPPPTGDRYILALLGTATQGWTDAVDLDTRLYPAVELDRSAVPDVIYIAGTGWQERTTLTLTVRGRGVPLETEASDAADVVFVVDDTGSMGGAIDALKADIQDITDRLQENVSDLRMGLVSFGDEAAGEVGVDIDLTYDIDAFRAAVDALYASGGGDGPEDGDIALELAANLSWRPGNVTRGMVHITDAPTHNDPHLPAVARWAWQVKEIHTNTVAVGGVYFYPPNLVVCYVSPLVEDWLRWTAENGTGSYEEWFVPMPPPYDQVCPQNDLGDLILTGLMGILPAIDTAARDPVVTDPDPMVRDVLPPHIAVVPGTFRDPATGAPRPPAFQGTDGNGNTVLEWNVSEVKVGTAWEVAFEATSSLAGLVPTNVFGLSRVSYENWSGSPQRALFPEVNVTVLDPVYLPPTNVTTTWDRASTVGLTWTEPFGPVDHYLVFKSYGDPRGFADLRASAAYAVVPAPAATWTDPEPLAGPGEWYYLMRASGTSSGNVSETSNTAGVFAKALPSGRTALSRPLEYFPWVDYSGPAVDTVAEHVVAFGASIEYLDAGGMWRRVPGAPDVRLEVGRTYVASSPGRLAVFTGLPGTMIRHDEHAFPGFDPAGSARSLTATVVGADVLVSFERIPGAASYQVWVSPTRTGFFDGGATLLSTVTAPVSDPVLVTHADALNASSEVYYQVVPLNAGLVAGSSTYSVGVWSRLYATHDTLALALRPESAVTVSWLADTVPGALGVLWLTADGTWVPHLAGMPAGVYDAEVPLASGVQVAVSATVPASVRISQAGW